MRRRLLALAAGLGAAPVLAATAKKARVVVQVSDADPARWNLVLNNVGNLQQDLGSANVEIEVIAYGPGLGMLKLDAVTNSRVSEAVKAGVRMAACENTMRNQNVARADMHPSIAYVPAGVVEIVRRQQDGWAYLRP